MVERNKSKNCMHPETETIIYHFKNIIGSINYNSRASDSTAKVSEKQLPQK